MTHLTSQQLHRAADLKEKIEALRAELGRLLGQSAGRPGRPGKRKRTMSAEARAKIGAAQRLRWARQKRQAT